MLDDKTIARLVSLAQERVRCYDDPERWDGPDDAYGGNFDDAFEGGERAGKAMLARDVLNSIGVPFVVEEE